MRILLVSKTTPLHRIGGLERHFELLSRALQGAGHLVHWLTTPLPAEGALPGNRPVPEGVVWHIADGVKPSVHSPAFWEKSAELFSQLHRKHPYDAIFSESISAYGLKDLPGHPPLSVFMQGFQPEHFLNRWQEVRTLKDLARYGAVQIPENILLTVAEARLVRRAAHVCVAGRHIGRRVRDWYGVREDRITYFPNWVEDDLFKVGERLQKEPRERLRKETRAGLGLEAGQTVFLFAGVLSYQKGALVALEAFKSHAARTRDSVLLIAGDGPEFDTLKVRTMDRIRFLGRCTTERMAALYAAADVFLMPTLRIEGMPYVLLEAVSSGLPVVATRLGGNEDVLGPDGAWVEPGDSEGLARHLDLLAGSPNLRAEMSKASRARAGEFSQQRAQDQLSHML